jgi:hypothetical protein
VYFPSLGFLLLLVLYKSLIVVPATFIADTTNKNSNVRSALSTSLWFINPVTIILTLVWYHGVYMTPVLFDSLFF